MPTKNLTDLFCERVKPPARGRDEYFDASFGGLALRVTEKGAKSFSVHYRINGKLRRYTLGRFPSLKPAQARRDASAALELARAGKDPTAAKKALRYLPSPDSDTFKSVLEDYLARHMVKNTALSIYAEAKRTLQRDVLPIWRERPIGSITRREVITLVDNIVARGAEVHANRVQARLRALFNWAVEKGRLAASPIEGMKPPTKNKHATVRCQTTRFDGYGGPAMTSAGHSATSRSFCFSRHSDAMRLRAWNGRKLISKCGLGRCP